MKEIIEKLLFGAAIAILLSMCLYAYVWRPYGQAMYLRGRGDTINAVMTQLQQKQEVAINNIILVPKKEPEIKNE